MNMPNNKYRSDYPLFLRNCKIIGDNKFIASEFYDFVMKLFPKNKKLYRFRKSNYRNIDAFKRDLLYISDAAHYKDAFDSLFIINFDDITSEIENAYNSIKNMFDMGQIPQEIINMLKICGKEIDNNYINMFKNQNLDLNVLYEDIKKVFNKNIIGIKRRCRSISFTEKINNLSMWDHYANGGDGFVIEYSIDNLNVYDKKGKMVGSFYPVAYDNKPFDITKSFINIYKNEFFSRYGINLNLPIDNDDFIKVQLFKSKECYKVEKEWRVLAFDIDKNIYLKPSAIYLGPLLKEKDRNRLIEIAVEKSIDVYAVDINPYAVDYSFEIRKIEYKKNNEK